MSSVSDALSPEQIGRARAAVASLCRETPLVPAPALGEDVYLKLESLQRTGSFKLRGAAAALALLEAPAVVCASAGNHGQGVALAARHLNKRARVFVSGQAPAIKRAAIAALGAEVVVSGASYDEAERAARADAARTGATFVSAFDDPAIWLGNGVTLGEELAAQLAARGVALRRVVVPVGGGGLLVGLLAALSGRAEIVGAQPAANCAMAESLELGRALTVYPGGATACEGLEGPVAERTYLRVRMYSPTMVRLPEGDIRAAVAFAYRTLGQVVEPSAAVGIAALRTGALSPRPGTVVVVTGGNVEPEWLDAALRAR